MIDAENQQEKPKIPTIEQLYEQVKSTVCDRKSRHIREILAPLEDRIREQCLDGTWEHFWGRLHELAYGTGLDKWKPTADSLLALMDMDVLKRRGRVRDDLGRVDIGDVLKELVTMDVNWVVNHDWDLQMELRPYLR